MDMKNNDCKVPCMYLIMLFVCCFSLSITFESMAQQKLTKDGAIRLKLSEEMAASLESTTFSKSSEGYLVTGIATLDQLNRQFKASGMKRVFRHGGKFEKKHQKYGLHLWYEVDISQSANTMEVARAYAELSTVKMAEAIYTKTRSIDAYGPLKAQTLDGASNDPLFIDQWHYENTGQTGGTPGADINLIPAWGIETGSADVIVAVTDGGIDTDHVDLADNMWVNEDEIPNNGIDDDNNGYVDDINGYGFGDDSPVIPADVHGSHVGGTVAATTNNEVGVAGVAGGSGIGDGVRLMSCASFGQFATDNFPETYIYGADNGAVISQNSWGYTSTGVFEQAVLDAIDYFIAEAGYDENGNPIGPMQGGIVIFAAGNDGADGDWYPGVYEPVMAVAGTDRNDNQYTSSNRGDWIEVAAPAVGVFSTFPDDQYGTLTGTSMACPHVSGVAALIVSKFAGDITPQQVKDRIIQTTDPLPGLVGFGSGRINAFSALQEDDGVPPDAITDLSVSEVFQNAITLTWTAPADVGNGSASEYDVRYSTTPIDAASFETAIAVMDVPAAAAQGTTETFTIEGLNGSTVYYFAIKSADFFGNVSSLSNIASDTTENAPVIAVSPESLNVSIDVNTNPFATEMLTVSNNGDGADLNYESLVVLIGQSSGRLLYPGNGYRQVDMALYGKGRTTAFNESSAGIGMRKNSKSMLSDVINVTDSIYYDEGDPIAEDFSGLSDGNAYTAAVRFEVDRPSFNLTHIRNFFRTEAVTSPVVILEVYKGSEIETAELLTAQEVSATSAEGDFFVTALESSQTFLEGDVFWVVHKYPTGVDFPQGVDDGFTQRPNTFFFSGDGGSTFNPSGFVFKTRALNASGGAGTDWITLNPSVGSIAPGNSEAIMVSFDGSDVANGTYSLDIVFNSNDPNVPTLSVPTEVVVSGQAPEIGTSTALLEFGSVLLQAEATLPVTITNEGLGTLEISEITTSFFSFSVDAITPVTLGSGETLTVDVTFAPTFAGNINGTLDIKSNDPDEGSISILLVGVGTSPPVMSVSPTAVSSTLNARETGTEQVTIANFGNYPLTFSFPDLAAMRLLNDPAIQKNDVSRITFTQQLTEDKNEVDQRVGNPVVLGAGSDLDFGYTWIDSDEAGGPVFVWDDIASSGTEININSDDGFTELPLGFNFNFYDQDKSTVRVSSNGYLTFGTDGSDFTNDQIPDAIDPNDYIAVFWDDLRPSAQRGKIYYKTEPGRFIVQYDSVGNYAGDGFATFQVVLLSNGNIMFYYNSMSDLEANNSATVGIENADATDGAQIVFNNTYVKDNFAVMIMAPQPQFVTAASPLTGVVGIGQQVSVDVTLDATELVDGTYFNDLIISSNDPVNSPATVPFTLTVIGQPEISVAPDTLYYDSLFIGLSKKLSFEIVNSGTKVLNIASINNSSSEFTADTQGPLTLEPGLGTTVEVTYTPATIGFITDAISIASDAVNSSVATIDLFGIGVDPPVINTSPDSLIAFANAGEQAFDSLLIENTGAFRLDYSIAGPFWLDAAPQQSATPFIDFGKDPEKGQDNRKGLPALYGGGSDSDFGYVWEDNKDGGGPEYDFEDITRAGIDITNSLITGSFADGDIEVPIGFEFPYYGNTYSSVRVSASGILMFDTPAGITYTNRQIPADDDVNNVIAGFWDDLEPGTVSGTVHYVALPEHFIVQFTDASDFSSATEGSVTFQMILFPDGKIKFLYEDVSSATFSNSGTVGIENGDATDGIQIVFNNNYIQDGLAVLFEGPVAGSVAPGESAPGTCDL